MAAAIIGQSGVVTNFNLLEDASKIEIYKKANREGNIALVRELNGLGMKPEVPRIFGPTIISRFMDFATKYDLILKYLKKLRSENRLVSKDEFTSLSNKKWVKKDRFNRMLGVDHLSQKIADLHLKHLKVPLKVAVITGEGEVSLFGYHLNEGLYSLDSEQIEVFAERIEREDRKLSREELDELIELIAASCFCDLWPQNFVFSRDGIYVIDAEFKSFGYVEWDKLRERFLPFVAEGDQEYFSNQVLKAQMEMEPYMEDRRNLFEEDVANIREKLAYIGSSLVKTTEFSFETNTLLANA